MFISHIEAARMAQVFFTALDNSIFEGAHVGTGAKLSSCRIGSWVLQWNCRGLIGQGVKLNVYIELSSRLKMLATQLLHTTVRNI
jgi:hypothetical protein